MTTVTYEPISRVEGLERLDLLDLDEIDDLVQGILREINPQLPGVQAHSGRNAGRSWLLFSYRTFEPPPASGIDPVVVGINLSRGSQGVLVSGDIAGELSGDIIFDVPAREFTGKVVIETAAEQVAESLRHQVDRIRAALIDSDRRC